MIVQQRQMALGEGLLLVRGLDDLLVGDAHRSTPVGAAMGEDIRLICPQLYRRAHMAMAIDDHPSLRVCRL